MKIRGASGNIEGCGSLLRSEHVYSSESTSMHKFVLRSWLILLLCLFGVMSRSLAQCTEQWLYGPDQGIRGIDGSVLAQIEWTIPGPDGPRNVLIVGGSFQWAGWRAASGLAYWDGDWHAFGTGVSGGSPSIRALCKYKGELIAAGRFIAMDGVSCNSIARWDGDAWRPLGEGIAGTVFSICVIGESLYVCGQFSSAGGVPANNVAVWNGTEWSALGAGLTVHNSTPSEVRALVEFQGRLFAAGTFTRSGAATIVSFASWDGSGWQQETSGLGGAQVMRVFKDRLYVGGDSSGGTSVGLRAWNGATWTSVAVSALSGQPAVYALNEVDGKLIVGGRFNHPTESIAAWDGTAWSTFGSGIQTTTDFILSVGSFEGQLIAGGSYGRNTSLAKGIAQWNGTKWLPMGQGVQTGLGSATVTSFCEWRGQLVKAGWFVGVGSISTGNIAIRQDGIWQTVGAGLPTGSSNRGVLALAAFQDRLIAAGDFSSSGSTALAGMGAWDGVAWHPVGLGDYSRVHALSVYNGNLVAGGEFTSLGSMGASYLAHWNGSNWSNFADGPTGSVYAFGLYRGELVVGGSFGSVGGFATRGIATWNGERWRTFGAGIGTSGHVRALTIHDGDLIIGGTFSSINGVAARGVARWNGTSWSAMGAGFSSGDTVWSLASYHGSLYATGTYFSTNGIPKCIARWNGSAWVSVGNGTNGSGATLYTFDDELLLGGAFTRVDGKASVGWARYGGCVWCPADFNHDGVVDDADFSSFVVGYDILDCADLSAPAACASDLNHDGWVDDADFVQFVLAYERKVCE